MRKCILCKHEDGFKREFIVLLLPPEVRNQLICNKDYQDLKKYLEPFLLGFVKFVLAKDSEKRKMKQT